MADFDSRIAAG